jgi:hypothetical protein
VEQHRQQHDAAFELDLDLGPTRDGREWVWPSGRRTPYLAGASDMGAGAPPAPDSGGGAPPPDAGGAPAAPDAGQGGAPAAPAGYVPQSIADQLRQEAEGYRKKWSPIADRFKDVDDGTLDALGGLVQALREDPQQAVEWMLTNGKALAGESWQQRIAREFGGQEEKPKLDLSDPEVFNRSVQEQVRAALEQHTQSQTATQQAQQIRSELKSAGVEDGTLEWREVIHHMRENGVGVEEAVTAVRTGIDEHAQRYARLKAEQARKAGTPPPSASAGQPGGTPAGGTAAEKMAARLAATRGQ